MRVLSFFIILSVLFVLFTSFVSASPQPRGIAVNEESGECAGFWPGDEFRVYDLPDSWTAYFPTVCETSDSCIETSAGACYDFIHGQEETCCRELGLTYAGENIGKGRITNWAIDKSMVHRGMPEDMMIDNELYDTLVILDAFYINFVMTIIGYIFYRILKRKKRKKNEEGHINDESNNP